MGSGVRVDLDGTLVVPPFECAWLTGQGYDLQGGSGCIKFEARGDTDVTVLLKPSPGRGTKRWQPLSIQRSESANQQLPQPEQTRPLHAGQQPGTAENGAQTPSSTSGLVGCVEPNYTVIFGSHRNSCLKIERNGSTVSQMQGVPGSKVSAKEWQHLWVDYHNGVLTVGTSSECCPDSISHQWVDADPLPNICCVGLSCWDRHISYRNIQVLPSHKFKLISMPSTQTGQASSTELAVGPISLHSRCIQVLTSHMGKAGVPACRVAVTAELLLPSTRTLYRSALEYLARNFKHIAAADTQSFTADSRASSMAETSRMAAHMNTQSGLASKSLERLGSSVPVSMECASSGSCSSSFTPGYNENSLSRTLDDMDTPMVPAHADAALHDLPPIKTTAGDAGSNLVVCSMLHTNAQEDFCLLTPSLLCQLLQQNNIPVSEKLIFDAVMQWAAAYNTLLTPGPSAAPDATNSLDALGSPRMSGTMIAEDSSMITTESVGWRATAEICKVLSLVRYPLMTAQELDNVMQQPLIHSHPQLMALVQEALGETPIGTDGIQLDSNSMEGKAAVTTPGGLAASNSLRSVMTVENRRLLHCPSAGDPQVHVSMSRFQRRSMPSGHECAYVSDGDTNGVLHFIGTMYGTQGWMNPVLARRIEIKASSPAGRHTDPKALAGDKFPRLNFAGPRYVNGAPDTWWLVDLTPAHSLIPTYCSLRADGSGEFIRSWSLQGSHDLIQWTDLQCHKADVTFKKAGQYASWPVAGPAAKSSYRAFRLLLTGPTTSHQSPYNFPLAHVELYGFLTQNNNTTADTHTS